jgi:hypothetical protein
MRPALLLLLPLIAGCEATDPFTAEGRWRPSGVNEANLRGMVADPAHLERGVETWRADGHLAAAAIDRLRRDRVKPLPASGVARIQATGSGSAPGGGSDGGR